MTGSQALIESLLEYGVDTVFGYPGGAIMPVYDALYDYRDKLNHILVRHEQGASHAAEGYARVTGRAGVCMATSGPGATNLVTGIADAMMDSVPMVAITGQVFRKLLGTDAFQETDVMSVTIPITKWNYQITTPDEIPYIVAKAFSIAEGGRPGPVVIDITKNAQIEEFTGNIKEELAKYKPWKKPEVDAEKISRAADLINSAKSPFLLVGHGVLISRAQEVVRDFVEKTGMPVASTLHGLSAFPTGHPNYVGMLGMHGNYGPNLLTNEADVLIGLGMRFDDRVTGTLDNYAKESKIIHIDIDQAEISKNVTTEVGLVADAKSAIEALMPLVEKRSHDAWVSRFRECDEKEDEKVIKEDLYPSTEKIKMSEVIRVLSEQTEGKAVVVADVGQHQMMAARYYQFQEPDSYITSGGLGTMGFAVPAAMGAQVGAPKRQVLAVVGDGCFQMTLQELGTIVQEKLPVKIIVLNNNFLGMVRQWQELFFDHRYSFVEMQNPDFVAISKGFGMEATRVSERENLEAEVRKMLDFDGPYFLEVMVEKETNVFPMVPAGQGVADVRLD